MPSDGDAPRDTPERPWTLGAIREADMQLEGHCQAPGCGWFGVFDLAQLIEALGADFVLPEHGPGVACAKCGADGVAFRLAFPEPETE